MDSGLSSTEQLFDTFLYSDQNLEEVLNQFQKIKNELQLNNVEHNLIFRKLKENFTSWRVTSFLDILQHRANVKEYASAVKSCKTCNIFVIGAGPCGLRFAIEAALCGARAVVVEKRTSFTRNNVLHLWPYLIHDLRNLGIKKLYGKFCAGSLDHISIRRLQILLVKMALVLGVDIHIGVSFVEYLEPCKSTGWRISVKPSTAHIESMDFDVLVGADGKRNSIPGFQRKEFRAKLAIGITANFQNKNTEEEAKIEEISGVAALFNQKFFADLKTDTDIELENIVYYKNDTHYFVMTAKKTCLLKKGVLKEDHADVMSLLSYKNVDKLQLKYFVKQAADFSCGLPHTDLAINPDNGEEDVAIFDFTSMYSAEYAAKIIEREGRRLLIGLVGDGLMEPFWPLGTGCARGFLSAFDFMWMVMRNQQGVSPEDILRERMALYQILHQTSNENMNKKHSTYTINPKSRYKFIPSFTEDISHLYDNEEKENVNKNISNKTKTPEKATPPKRKLAGETTETVHKQWKKSTYARTRKPKNPTGNNFGQKRAPTPESETGPVNDQESLLKWCKEKLKPILPYIPILDLDSCWRDGVLLCGLVHLCSPKHIDMDAVKNNSDHVNVELAITVMFNDLGIQPLTSEDVLPPHGPDLLAIITTIIELKRLYEELQSPAKTPSKRTKTLTPPKKTTTSQVPKPSQIPKTPSPFKTPSPLKTSTNITPSPSKPDKTKSEAAKTPSSKKPHSKSPEPEATHAPIPSVPGPNDAHIDIAPMEMPPAGSLKKRVRSQRKLRKKTESKFVAQVDNSMLGTTTAKKVVTPRKGSQKCHTCAESVLILKRVAVEGYVFHRKCFVCEECQTPLKTSTYHLLEPTDQLRPGVFYCKTHFDAVLSKSKELLSSAVVVGQETPKKPEKPNRKAKRPAPRPQSAALDSLQFNNTTGKRTKSPAIPEDPTENRYSDTSQQIYLADNVTRTKEPLLAKEVKTPATVVVTDPSAEHRGRIKTRDHSPAISDTSQHKKQRNTYPDIVPHEMSSGKDTDASPNRTKSPQFDSLPVESMPTPIIDNSHVTTRKKTKKTKPAEHSVSSKKSFLKTSDPKKDRSEKSVSGKGEKSPVFKKDDKNSNIFKLDGGRTSSMISQSAVSLSPSSPAPTNKRNLPQTPIAAGVSGRKVNSAYHGNRHTSRPTPRGLQSDVSSSSSAVSDNSSKIISDSTSDRVISSDTPLSSKPPVARFRPGHARADSMNDLEKYLPKSNKKSSRRKGPDEDDIPMSVKDRIAMYSNIERSASTAEGEKKRIPVSPNLKHSINRDSNRIAASRTPTKPKTVETDGNSPTKVTMNPTPCYITSRRKRRLRLKPTTKKNQRRLEQAQIIQRDRSLLEQKMAEFENNAAAVEHQLRQAGTEDAKLLSEFLELVNIKNELTRRENELHLCEKYLQLLDEQDQIERDSRFLIELEEKEKTEEDREEEERLILKKFDVVNRRDCLLMQIDNDKRREEEENEQINAMLNEKRLSSNTYNYTTENIITIEALLETSESDESFNDEEAQDSTVVMYEQSTEITYRDKKKREAPEENILTKFFSKMSIFSEK